MRECFKFKAEAINYLFICASSSAQLYLIGNDAGEVTVVCAECDCAHHMLLISPRSEFNRISMFFPLCRTEKVGRLVLVFIAPIIFPMPGGCGHHSPRTSPLAREKAKARRLVPSLTIQMFALSLIKKEAGRLGVRQPTLGSRPNGPIMAEIAGAVTTTEEKPRRTSSSTKKKRLKNNT